MNPEGGVSEMQTWESVYVLFDSVLNGSVFELQKHDELAAKLLLLQR